MYFGQTTIQKIPFLRIFTPFALGIILQNQTPILASSSLVFLSVLTALFLSCLICRDKDFTYITLLYVFLFAAGFTSAHVQKELWFHSFTEQSDLKHRGYVMEKTGSKENSRLIFRITESYSDSLLFPNREKIMLFCKDTLLNNRLEAGSVLSLTTHFYPVKSRKNPGEFDYKRYLCNKGIRFQGYLTQNNSEIETECHNSLYTKAQQLRAYLLQSFRENRIAEDNLAILAALSVGDKSLLSGDIREQFAVAGVMHVLAVSGLHVGIVMLMTGFLLFPLNRLKNGRTIKSILVILFIWLYGFVAGLSPSILRACTMFSFVTIGNGLKRKTNIYNTLCISAFVLSLNNPSILFEAGFQLSYSAVLAIVFLQPKIVALVTIRNRVGRYCWELFSVSLAAQAGTFPLVLYYFHQFPVYFWLSNLIIIPLITILLYLIIVFIFTHKFSIIASFLTDLLDALLSILRESVEQLSELPNAVIKNIWISPVQLIILLILTYSLASFIFFRKHRYFQLSLAFSCVFYVLLILQNYHTNRQKYLIAYNCYDAQMLSIIDGKQHTFFFNGDSFGDQHRKLIEDCTGYYKTQQAIQVIATKDSLDCKARAIKLNDWQLNCLLVNQNIHKEVPLESYDIIFSGKQSLSIYKYHKISDRNTIKLANLKLDAVSQHRQKFNIQEMGAITIMISN